MRLVKFKCTNYKSIKSIDPCWLADDLTTFAGKNESGKTTALEAMSDFDKDIERIREEAVPLEDADLNPCLEFWFSPPDEVWAEMFESAGIKPNADCEEYKEKNGVPVIRTDTGKYCLGKEFERILDSLTETDKKKRCSTINSVIKKLSEKNEDFEVLRDVDIEEKSELQDLISSIDKLVLLDETLSSNEDIMNCINDIKSNGAFLIDTVNYDSMVEVLEKHLPRFVFFSSFEQVIPYQVPLSDVENHPSIMDFIKVAEIDLEKVRDMENEQRRANLLDEKAAELTGNFSGYWKQDTIELSARVTDGNFIICVREKNKTTQFMPAQRSKGFQWYLAFYLRLKAQSVFETDRNTVILIDEPGLYLHATAQQDVLKVLESLSNDRIQILFSTHSPYLLDTSRFDRIRLVCRDKKKGTAIYNKVHVGADRDALTPIITAMGLDISKETTLLGKSNVLLEGISDYYFLLGMAEYLKMSGKISNFSFIPGKSASQMHLVASILIGWGQNFVAVVDNDQAGKAAHKDLRTLNVDEDKILPTSSQTDGAIEDLFSQDDFINYVLPDDYAVKTAEGKINSGLVKGKADKVIWAKILMDKIRSDDSSLKFSPETIDNFTELFDKIISAFDKTEKVESIKPVANDLIEASKIGS